MDTKSFIENLRQQYIDPEEVVLDMDCDFKQVGSFDSLTGMAITVMLKDEYGVEVSDQEFRSKKTVQDLYDFVLSNK